MSTLTKPVLVLSWALLAGVGLMSTVHASQLSTAHASQLDGAQYLKSATVKLVTARTIALKACDGKIIAQELEREHGGSGLRYSFDIRKNGVVHEVGVDAKTGNVLENSIDKGNDEADTD